jgi:dipeptidyl aminopeptidase/acylaminoacyl peptidase
VTYAERFKSPVLILHGEADPGVPSGQAREMAAELERHGKVHECYIYPGEGHQFAGPDAIADSMRRIEHFLATHLSGQDATSFPTRSIRQHTTP